MKRLFVWVRLPNGEIRFTGELAATEPVSGGRFRAEFEYAADWADDPVSFALDPESLPLLPRGRRFHTEQLNPPLAVFDDALPDDWGRRLLTQALKLDGRSTSPLEMLVHLGGGGTGALEFTEQPVPPAAVRTLDSSSLRALLNAAAKFEAGTLPPNAEFRKLLEGSSRAGGARPKALVHDETGEWVAKFPSRSRDGPYDVVGLEATCLQLARRAGLTVPDFRLHTVGRRRVLLVRRFDTTRDGGRVHMISMRTLCKERPGIFATSYSELAQVLSKHSAVPSADGASLFRHMAFNAAIGNIDDHLKNFWMLATRDGFRLAPAFDLVPDISGRREHTLSFQYGYACPTREQILAVASEWRVSNATEILDEVVRAVAAFAATARKLEVRAGKSLDAVHDDIRRRLSLLKQTAA